MQDRALQMLMLMDRVEQTRSLFDQIKIRALGHQIDIKQLRSLFPEYFPEDPFEDALREDGTVDPDLVDEDAIEFSLPRDRSEDEAISAWIREREAGSISGAVIGDWM